MMTERKNILVAGLGTKVSDTARETLNFDPSETMSLVATEVEKAKASGFDCTIFIVEPWDQAGNLKNWRAKLKKQHWDAVSIGGAVRVLKENTKLFEALLNVVMEEATGVKLVFPDGRTDIWVAIQRVFGVDDK